MLDTAQTSEAPEAIIRVDNNDEGNEMANFSGKAPTMIVWVISLVLFIVALAAHFGLVRLDAQIAAGAWIIGFALLLIACRVRGL